MEILMVKRVPYGKDTTPADKREYKMYLHNSPVGTPDDWQQYARDHNYNKIEFLEKDGSVWSQYVFKSEVKNEQKKRDTNAVGKNNRD